jgi:hypothetical protein
MKYYYWVFLGILFVLMCYTLANREVIIVEMMESKAPVGPVPADPSLVTTKKPLSDEDRKTCEYLQSLKKTGEAWYNKAVEAEGGKETVAFCQQYDYLTDPEDLASQVAALKKKIDTMEASSQAQINNAQAAVASVSPPGSTTTAT